MVKLTLDKPIVSKLFFTSTAIADVTTSTNWSTGSITGATADAYSTSADLTTDVGTTAWYSVAASVSSDTVTIPAFETAYTVNTDSNWIYQVGMTSTISAASDSSTDGTVTSATAVDLSGVTAI